MCGIAGILLPASSPGNAAKQIADSKVMADSLSHRGPDGEGFWNNADESVFLSHRRLAVVDLSPQGAQPMHFINRYSIVYNGEIYNYPEIKKSLQALGATFSSNSDTEVLLQAFHYWGEGCLKQFDGMFAFLIWDELEKTAFFARDRFGEKPFYYCWDTDRRFLFASEMKAFWALGLPKIADDAATLYFLATGKTNPLLSAENSFFQEIFQLPAASCAWLRPAEGIEKIELERYWDLDTKKLWEGNAFSAVEAFGRQFGDSVAKRLRADLPCGTSLSGGIDSASIGYQVSSELTSKYQSFSAIFPGFEKDESTLIRALTKQLNIESHQVVPTVADLENNLEKLLYHQEEPISSASVLVQYMVFEQAKNAGITVLLDGQGADEVLGGYDSVIPWYLLEKWRKGRWQSFSEEKALFRKTGWEGSWGLKNYAAAFFPGSAQAALERRERRLIMRTPFASADRKAAFPWELLEKPLVLEVNDILYDELMRSRLPELLRYADRNSMAHGRELRLPFLQHQLVELAFSFPASYKFRDGYRKWVLRQSMESKLPDEIVWQGKKIGYEPPQQQWMSAPVMQDRVIEARKKLVSKGILDKKVLSAKLAPGSAYELENADWRHLVLATI